MKRELIASYMNTIIKAVEHVSVEEIEKVVDMIYARYLEDRRVFIVGNGGSAATASHFCCDLAKGAAVEDKPRLQVLSLNDNIPLLTAYANDCGYDTIFVQQLKSLIHKGDLLICISASGNSQNILRAIEYADEKGAQTIGLLGFDGGKAKAIVSFCILVNNDNYGLVEDIHLILCHSISQCFKNIIMNT